MKKNLGFADGIMRLATAAMLVILVFTQILSGTLGILAIVVSVIFVVTSVFGYCPIYTLLNLNTYAPKSDGSD